MLCSSSGARKGLRFAVHAIHEDMRFTRTMTRSVQAELEDLVRGSGWARPSP